MAAPVVIEPRKNVPISRFENIQLKIIKDNTQASDALSRRDGTTEFDPDAVYKTRRDGTTEFNPDAVYRRDGTTEFDPDAVYKRDSSRIAFEHDSIFE
ncbi:uncharacterized protein MYCFIDRAFT_133152 [Pseudocercospora fijiensis CIRAD86]|uniref:Uncharacterized protein n=1 Tax=Pseudocercospora fijiensis (strain CIRAD86) TaxID=383855 RepID=M3AL69_PSEFD|nr:uncharacterized protein MYCFIDRAFT_133152 [Pseudocercospora fijiensis CIRAD86]EME85311.1 hypothetical protein MYCFIDRAFT_133152 [Pseudocercospora fijiensis CIRAD86]